MTPEASFPCSQQPDTEPHEFSARSLLIFPLRFSISLPSTHVPSKRSDGYSVSYLQHTWYIPLLFLHYLIKHWPRQVATLLFTFSRSDFNKKCVMFSKMSQYRIAEFFSLVQRQWLAPCYIQRCTATMCVYWVAVEAQKCRYRLVVSCPCQV
jgi:hypothetical protein